MCQKWQNGENSDIPDQQCQTPEHGEDLPGLSLFYAQNPE